MRGSEVDALEYSADALRKQGPNALPLQVCASATRKGRLTMTSDEKSGNKSEQLRPARMQIETTVLISRHEESHPTELVDISATGALLRRPLGWSGQQGQRWVLDMIFGHNLHIHLEASIARISDHHIGFSYSHIPEDKQVPLWNLLGGYADILEYWTDK
jgi:hypothetical protein